MRSHVIRHVVPAMWLVVFSLVAASPLWAVEGFPEPVRVMIQKAIAKDDGAHLISTVQLAAEAVPDSAAQIFAIVEAEAPGRAAEVAAALGLPVPQTDAPVMADAVPVAPPPPSGFFAPETWDGRIELGGSLNTGNTEEEAISAGLELSRETDRWLFELKSVFDFQSSNGTTNKQRFAIDTQINRTINERFYAFGNVGYVDDQFSGFAYRITTAGGLGYYVFQGEPFEWRVEAGPAIRIDKPNTTNSVDIDPAGIARSKVAWIISDTASFINDTTVIVDGGTTVDNLIALDLAITEAIKARLSYSVRFDDSPPAGTEKVDTTTKASILYDF